MRYRKRPLVIDAFQMTAEYYNNQAHWPNWALEACTPVILPFELSNMELANVVAPRTIFFSPSGTIYVKTLEGSIKVNVDDWLIKGVEGELYPCQDSIFRTTYEEVLE